MRLLGIVAVKEEAEAIGCDEQIEVLIAGVGAVNAASCLSERLSKGTPPDCVLSLGVAGILPQNKLQIGDVLIANRSVYFEEGIETPHGWRPLESIGFSLLHKDASGYFKDNAFIPSELYLNRIKNIAIKIKKPPIMVFVAGTSLIPSQGSQTQNIPPITSVKDNKVKSAAGIFFDPIEYNIRPQQTSVS